MSVSMILSRPADVRRLRQGPLEPYLDTFVARALSSGFARGIVRRQLWAVAHLSGYLANQECSARDLDEHRTTSFLRARHRYGRRYRSDSEALRNVLALLREMHVCPPATKAVLSRNDSVIAAFQNHMLRERGLARATIVGHMRIARLLTADYPAELWATLSTEDIRTFIKRQSRHRSPGTAKNVCNGVRSFLRYLLASGQIAADLTPAIPCVRHYKLSAVPEHLRPGEVERVLRHCDRRTPDGRRDYAILVILARLGLRAGEVIALTLDDIDWQSGELFLRHTKSGGNATMPLPREVGQALVHYLKGGRPSSASRKVFLRHVAPHIGLAGPSIIGHIARTALRRASIAPRHRAAAHLFRHSLASQMLHKGASLRMIGELLRHQHPDTTRIYAKVDMASLRPLAMPWPGDAS